MEALIDTVQDQAEQGEFDEFTDIMGDLGNRPQELTWKEDDEGVLFVGDDTRRPEVVARVELIDGLLTATEVEPDNSDWRKLRTVSEPDSAVRDRQYD